jgi:DNA-binding NtrC family response regulator
LGYPAVHSRPISETMSYVLIVDDETSIRVLAARWLERMGHGVKAAASAVEAIELFRLERPAALVCDVGLPDHDGFWLVRQVREHGTATPIVMMSGYIDLPGAAHNVEYIAKPFGRDVLAAALERAMRSAGEVQGESASPKDRRELPPCPSCGRTRGVRLPVSTNEGQLRWFKCAACAHIWKKGPRAAARSVDSML